MQARVVYELSRHLAVLLEHGIRDEGGCAPVPVFLGHPHDLVERRAEAPDENASGVLYLYRLGPDARLHASGKLLEESRKAGAPDRLRAAGVWLRLRYAFVVVGGLLEDELGALTTAVRVLHDHPLIPLTELSAALAEDGRRDEDGDDASDTAYSCETTGVESLPLRLVDDPGAWREIGLGEHHLAVVFEVSVPLLSRRVGEVWRVLERELDVRTPARPRREDGE